MCECFDCLRAIGVTDPRRKDCRGEKRFPPDGRYLMGRESVESITTEGKTIHVEVDTGLPARFIGT